MQNNNQQNHIIIGADWSNVNIMFIILVDHVHDGCSRDEISCLPEMAPHSLHHSSLSVSSTMIVDAVTPGATQRNSESIFHSVYVLRFLPGTVWSDCTDR